MNPFKEYIETLQNAHMEEEFCKFSDAFEKAKRVIILGNGGSNAVASHISQDYMKFKGKRVSVFSDPSMLTMMINDFGHENAYRKYLEYYWEPETLVILMSSGGESKNILNCVRWCQERKVTYGVLTGFSPDNTIKMTAADSEFNYHIDSDSYGVVECCHQIFLHGVI